jgi:hypothetical protein
MASVIAGVALVAAGRSAVRGHVELRSTANRRGVTAKPRWAAALQTMCRR